MASQLLNIVIGAGLAMLAQAVIQLWVVPRVDARKRREDRWERDVLALGELLTADLPDSARAAWIDQWSLQLMSSLQPPQATVAEHAEAIQSRVEKATEAVQRYEAQANTRVRWLAQRIVALAPNSDKLQKFYLVYVKFSLASGVFTGYHRPVDEYNEEKFEREWRDEQQTRRDLTSVVEDLASSSPPRRPSRLHQSWRWLVERWKR